jgi:hypothetical protein
MAYEGFSAINPFALPRTVDPSASLAELNPWPPPGRPLNAKAHNHPLTYAHVEAKQHTVTVLFAETVSEGGVWVLTVIPTKMVNGVPIADGIGAVSLTVTVGATHTITALGDLFVTEFAEAKAVTTVAGVDSANRIGEILASITNSSGTITLKSAQYGETFSVSVTPEAGGSSTITTTVDGAGTDIQIGVAVVRSGTHADGSPIVRACTTGDTAATVFGIVADGNRTKPIDSDDGYSAQYYKPGRMIPIIPIWDAGGMEWTAYAEAAVDVDDDIYVRITAGAGEVAGALNDSATTDTVDIWTMTPTAANSTVYRLVVTVWNFFTDAYVTEGILECTSDADGTAAEVVTALKASLLDENDLLDDYVVGTGTGTLILTVTAGYRITVQSTGPGDLAEVHTQTAVSDHVKLAAPKKFSRTTSAAGTCVVRF